MGSGESLKSALLHPFPSSRRHVIRVDMAVLVDVIRLAFWMEVVMDESKKSILGGRGTAKFKIMMECIEIST